MCVYPPQPVTPHATAAYIYTHTHTQQYEDTYKQYEDTYIAVYRVAPDLLLAI